MKYFLISLIFRWFPEVQNIFYQGNKKKLIPGTQQTKKFNAFFNAAAVLMSNQLQSLGLLSLYEYKELFDHSVNLKQIFHPVRFIVRLVLDGLQIKFEPDFNDFKIILLNVLDIMVKSVMVVPCIETKLYSEWSNQKRFLKPNIEDQIVDTLKNNIAEVIKKESNGPVTYAQIYDKYQHLINRDADHQCDDFLLQGHDFDTFIAEVKKYTDIIEDINFNSQKVEGSVFFQRFGFY